MAPPEPRDRPLDGLLRKASPDGDLMAQHALVELQARLFGKPKATIEIGRYVLEDRIGAGGSGVVYRAFDPKHDRKVALKLLHAQEGKRYEAARDRLLREAQTLGKLHHPNIVRIYDVGTYDPAALDPSAAAGSSKAEGVYLAMELLDGSDLAQWLEERPRDWQQVREVFLAAGRGLAAAHARGLIHRDFKPANVSIDGGDHVRVLDFGLARPTVKDISDPSLGLTAGAQERLEELARPLDATLTAPGTLLGTPAYMAPEQHELQRATALSDQYSFCLSLYEAWYGHRPFLANSEKELQRLKRAGDVLQPPDDSEVPRGYFEALVRGLSPRPDDRFESMDALLEALSAPPARARRRPGWLLATAAGFAVVLGGGMAWLAWSPDEAKCTSSWADGWDEDLEASLARRATAAGPYAEQAARTITEQLATRVNAGRHLDAERCEAAPEAPTPTDVCLHRRTERLATLLAALPEVDGPALARVARWLPTAPTASECRDGTANELEELLHDARLLEALGRPDQALELAARAHTEASQQGDPSRLTTAAALHGHLALATGALPEAEQALTEALWSGGTARSDHATHRAAEDLLELARRSDPRPADTSLWIRLAREHATMPSVDPPTRLRLHLALGRLALTDGDAHRARADLEQGLALPLVTADPVVVYEARLALAEALEHEGDDDQAASLRASARAEAIEQLGAEHPQLVTDRP